MKIKVFYDGDDSDNIEILTLPEFVYKFNTMLINSSTDFIELIKENSDNEKQ